MLEHDVPLSRSQLWGLQRAFYVRQGLRAWAGGAIPHHITCNPVIAAAYAEVLVGYLHDRHAAGRLDVDERFHVLELGSGSGRFAYLLLRRLRPLLAASSLRGLRCTLVLSDVDDTSLEQLATHPRLQRDLDEGWLDLTIFDAAAPGDLRTWRSGTTLRGRPLAVLANYVFDSLPAEAYVISGGVAHQARLSILSDAPEVDVDDPDLMDRLQLHWDVAVEPTNGSGSPSIDDVLTHYCQVLDGTTVLLPTTAIGCLESLAATAEGPMLALVADKGWTHPRELHGLGWPSIVTHRGCFSMMVDFGAVSHLVRARGGTALLPPHQAQNLVVAAFVLDELDIPATADRYADRLAEGGPDDIHDVQACQVPAGQLTLTQALSVLRTSRWDTHAFVGLFPHLLALAPAAPPLVQADLAHAVHRIWDGWFPIGEPFDLALCLGLLLASIGRHGEALGFFAASRELVGATATAHLAAALAHHALGELDLAGDDLAHAMALEPDLPECRALADQIEVERQR